MKRFLKVILFSAFLFLAGCSAGMTREEIPNTGLFPASTGTVVTRPVIQNTDQLIRTAQTYGVNLSDTGILQQPYFKVPARVLQMNGESIQVFEFNDAGQAQQAVSQIGQSGKTIAGQQIQWSDTPHFWQNNQMVILYVGHTQSILAFLNSLFGAQVNS